MSEYHVPVLLQESIAALNLKAGGIYVDATLGGGGHSTYILQQEPALKLFSFDQDPESLHQNKSLQNQYPENLTVIGDSAELTAIKYKLLFQIFAKKSIEG